MRRRESVILHCRPFTFVWFVSAWTFRSTRALHSLSCTGTLCETMRTPGGKPQSIFYVTVKHPCPITVSSDTLVCTPFFIHREFLSGFQIEKIQLREIGSMSNLKVVFIRNSKFHPAPERMRRRKIGGRTPFQRKREKLNWGSARAWWTVGLQLADHQLHGPYGKACVSRDEGPAGCREEG